MWTGILYPEGQQKHNAVVSPKVDIHGIGDASLKYTYYRSGTQLGEFLVLDLLPNPKARK